MTRTAHLAAAALAALLLSACGQSEPEVVGGPAPDAIAKAAADKAPVVLPPAIASSRTYRCKDNSLVAINFMTDNVTANLRPSDQPTATPIVLTAPAAGEPFVAEGYKLTGNGGTVTYASPDKPAQSCTANG